MHWMILHQQKGQFYSIAVPIALLNPVSSYNKRIWTLHTQKILSRMFYPILLMSLFKVAQITSDAGGGFLPSRYNRQ